MNIAFSPYRLWWRQSYATLDAKTFRKGALLKIAFEEGIGYADCHPWPELGDLLLNQQLQALKSGLPTPLLHRSLAFARLDAAARQRGKSVFEGLAIPPSHQLVCPADDLAGLMQQGLTHFKLKCGQSLADEKRYLLQCQDARFRLDFNAKLTRPLFLNYWHALPPHVQRCIDFVEDPYPFDPELWQRDQADLNVDFAADKAAKEAALWPASAAVLVHKPAVEMLPASADCRTQIVVTAYLDHPLGQMCAAYTAAELKKRFPSQVGRCGLLTHRCYQDDAFISAVQATGPFLHAPQGTGFGFNSLLEKIAWQTL